MGGGSVGDTSSGNLKLNFSFQTYGMNQRLEGIKMGIGNRHGLLWIEFD